MNKRHYEHTLPNIRGSLSNTYVWLCCLKHSTSSSSSFSFLLFFCRKSAAFSMEEKTAFGSNELYSCHALQLKRIYISAFILLLAAISYLIIRVDNWQNPIPLVTEPGLSYSVSGSNSGYMKAGNRPLLRSVESWQENQSFPVYRFLSLHCRHPTL